MDYRLDELEITIDMLEDKLRDWMAILLTVAMAPSDATVGDLMRRKEQLVTKAMELQKAQYLAHWPLPPSGSSTQ
jgi:hypothetical protein